MILFVAFLSYEIGKIHLLAIFGITFSTVIFALALITGTSTDKLKFIGDLRKFYFRLIYDVTTVILFLSFLLFIASAFFLPPPYAAISAMISLAIGVFVGVIFYVRSFWKNYVARVVWGFLVFAFSTVMIPVSRTLASMAIERKTALSAESFSTAWDLILLFYAIPLIAVVVFFISFGIFFSVHIVMFSLDVGKFNFRLVVFFFVVGMFSYFAAIYTERWLLQFTDDLIAFTFVQNCRAATEGDTGNCICEGLPESAYIHFYEGNNVVEAKLRSEASLSNRDPSNTWDFNYVGDGKSLKCAGVSMWPT